MKIAKTPPRIIYLSPPMRFEESFVAIYRIGVYDAAERLLALLAQHQRTPLTNLTAAIMAEADNLAGYEECPNN